MLKIIPTKFNDAYLLEPTVHGDDRGFFIESYNQHEFEALGLNIDFVQDNHSLSIEPGTIRGMHYQLNPKAQTKVVRVTVGAVYDVIIDIRKTSPTFGHWQGFILTAANYRQLVVPRGFAHGFCTLVKNTEVLYKVDEFYSSRHERGILWSDPTLGIDWPTSNPILSEKDSSHPLLADAEIFL